MCKQEKKIRSIHKNRGRMKCSSHFCLLIMKMTVNSTSTLFLSSVTPFASALFEKLYCLQPKIRHSKSEDNESGINE